MIFCPMARFFVPGNPVFLPIFHHFFGIKNLFFSLTAFASTDLTI
jgi:hypothetical protein